MAEIYNGKSNTLLSGTGGDDYMYNYGSDSKINGGIGNDSILNFRSNVQSTATRATMIFITAAPATLLR